MDSSSTVLESPQHDSALNNAVTAKAAELGIHLLKMCTAAGSGHPSSALSLAHLVVCLMYKQMHFDPNEPGSPNNDRLILSEGHAVPIIYAALADLGCSVASQVGGKGESRMLMLSDLLSLRDINSVLDGHPNPFEGVPFFDAATGSLGQGLSVAAGLGLGAYYDNHRRKRFYCIIGDGESREGQIQEALDFILDHKLLNVCPIFNCNGQGQADYVSTQQSAEMTAKRLKVMGYNVRLIDGHNATDIMTSLDKVGRGNKPTAIVARTVKGWGVPTLQDKSYHGKPLTQTDLETGVAQLQAIIQQAGVEPLQDRPFLPPAKRKIRNTRSRLPAPEWEKVLAEYPEDLKKAQSGKVAGRLAWAWALRELGKLNPAIVAVDGDVSNSTHANIFAKVFPDRFFECKIAEQNMISVAAGLSASGKIPFASTFAKFLARAYDQIEMAAISRANIKFVGTHAGITLASDGPSQMSLQDIAYFRSLASSSRDGDPRHPACVVFMPADAICAWNAVSILANHVGLAYLRLLRADTPMLYKPDTVFRIGGSHILRVGDAISLVAHTYMVHECLKAADLLAQSGINVSVIDAYSLPLDSGPILEHAARTQNRILVVEDNFGGGLYSAVAEAAAATTDNIRVLPRHVTRMPKSGRTPDDVLRYCGLHAEQLVDHVKTLI